MATAAAQKEVYAEHGYGFDRYTGGHVPTTFFFADEGKRRQLGWVRGHLADGALHEEDFERHFVVRLIGAERRAAA